MRKLRPRDVDWLVQGHAVNLQPGQGEIPAECSFLNTKLHPFGWFIFWLSVCTAWIGIVPCTNGPESAPAEERRVDLPESGSGFSFQLGCMTLGKSYCLFFFFFLIFTTTKMSLSLDLGTSFICGLLPGTGGPVCSAVWEGSHVAFSSIGKKAMTCYHWLKFRKMGGGVSDTCPTWTRCFLFFFFFNIYLFLTASGLSCNIKHLS